MRMIARLCTMIGCAAALLASSTLALAVDRVTLKSGKTIEGEIVREVDGIVWLKTATGTEMYTTAEYSKVERGVDRPAGDPSAARPASPSVAPAETVARRAGVPRAAVITLEEMVGIYMTAKVLEDAIPALEEEKVDIVVLKIKSGGGLLLEIQRLSDVIHLKYKPRFRTVAWIESAISAAAMTAHCVEEIYFMPQGNYGACTGYSGPLNAMKGPGLEQVLFQMEKISARGGYPKEIMRAMQISSDEEECKVLGIAPPTGALSATIDETTGEVRWYQDNTSGDYVLNPKGGVRVLTFNALDAERFKFSKGTAGTLDELARKMGLTEVEWVGRKDPKYFYPVSKAEEITLKFREAVKRDQENLQRYFRNYQANIAMARQAQDEQERGKWVNLARRELENIRRMVRNNPNIALLSMNMLPEDFDEWYEQQEKLLRDLLRNGGR
ncbi:MAG: hypothetical protein HRU70_07965 [Phycisphaeraceae bacterium]|nr:MAG: hypothetical protein HRU70_07965 [Phycisphaeraceae bacterium]